MHRLIHIYNKEPHTKLIYSEPQAELLKQPNPRSICELDIHVTMHTCERWENCGF